MYLSYLFLKEIKVLMHYIFTRIISLKATLTLIGLLLDYQAIHSIDTLSDLACKYHWIILLLTCKVNHWTECESSSLYQLVATWSFSCGSRREITWRASIVILKGLNAILLSEVRRNHLTELVLIIMLLVI